LFCAATRRAPLPRRRAGTAARRGRLRCMQVEETRLRHAVAETHCLFYRCGGASLSAVGVFGCRSTPKILQLPGFSQQEMPREHVGKGECKIATRMQRARGAETMSVEEEKRMTGSREYCD
jgi:hypothetical protein